MPAPRKKTAATPFWATADGETVKLYLGNVTDVLAALPAKSVHMCVTSPPYWGLRAYATGDAKHQEIGAEPSPDCKTDGQAQCGRCFVCSMVAVFRKVRQVLRDDGTLWLNLGDTMGGGKSGRSDNDRISGPVGTRLAPDGTKPTKGGGFNGVGKSHLPPGNLVGVPWRVALALQADGWVLRQDIIWAKPSPMPESVKNRCTKAHEYVFLFAKGPGYYYDAEAIKEKAEYYRPAVNGRGETPKYAEMQPSETLSQVAENRNKRSVWTVAAAGYPGAHFACYPPKLIEPMIKAGTSERGACGSCGCPWVRVVEERKLTRERPNDYVKRTGEDGTGNSCANTVAGVDVKTVGWRPGCECNGRLVKRKVRTTGRVDDAAEGKNQMRLDMAYHSNKTTLGAYKNAEAHEEEKEVTVIEYVSELPLDDHPVVPCTVLDPFIGSGTTCCVALDLGRRSIGIDLSEQYLAKNSVPRIVGALASRPELAWLAGNKKERVEF